MLAYPQCTRRSIPLSETTIDEIFKFYREDGISRVSSNSKDVMKINGQPTAVRFMEMTVLDAYRIFNERFPAAVARSTFYTLRPREVKIETLHDTCVCIIHENMHLLLKVGISYVLTQLYRIFITRWEQSLSKICQCGFFYIRE